MGGIVYHFNNTCIKKKSEKRPHSTENLVLSLAPKHTHADTYTHTQTQTHRQTTDRQTHRHTHRQTQTHRHTDRQQTHRQTDTQAHTQTDTDTQTHTQNTQRSNSVYFLPVFLTHPQTQD